MQIILKNTLKANDSIVVLRSSRWATNCAIFLHITACCYFSKIDPWSKAFGLTPCIDLWRTIAIALRLRKMSCAMQIAGVSLAEENTFMLYWYY